MKCNLTTSKSVMACFNYKLNLFGSHADTVSKWNFISTQKFTKISGIQGFAKGEGRFDQPADGGHSNTSQ